MGVEENDKRRSLAERLPKWFLFILGIIWLFAVPISVVMFAPIVTKYQAEFHEQTPPLYYLIMKASCCFIVSNIGLVIWLFLKKVNLTAIFEIGFYFVWILAGNMLLVYGLLGLTFPPMHTIYR